MQSFQKTRSATFHWGTIPGPHHHPMGHGLIAVRQRPACAPVARCATRCATARAMLSGAAEPGAGTGPEAGVAPSAPRARWTWWQVAAAVTLGFVFLVAVGNLAAQVCKGHATVYVGRPAPGSMRLLRLYVACPGIAAQPATPPCFHHECRTPVCRLCLGRLTPHLAGSPPRRRCCSC
jgi:hypothetical protein